MDALTLASYNISFAEPSFVAPNRALRAKEAPRLIREECLRSHHHHPDIIALQESPYESWGETTFGPEYVSMGTQVASHVQRGHIDLLVRRELLVPSSLRHGNSRRIALEHPALPLPAVAAAITLSDGTCVVVCSIHLPHTAKGATARELMCEAIMQIISHQYSNFILIGDFNMRASEDRVIENLAGGGWIDVWKDATGEDKNVKFSWDSRKNLFHEPGPNSFQFVARFDRCYVKGNELASRHYDLIGNQPIDGRKGDYLSDHYGIVVEVGVRTSSLLANSGTNPGMNKAKINKHTIGNNMNDTGMVDLTGDSDSDDGESEMTSKRRSDKRGSGGSFNISHNANNNAVGKNDDGNISTEEMRRLRIQKFSETVTTVAQKSDMSGRKAHQPSTIESLSTLLTCDRTAPNDSNQAACQQVASMFGFISESFQNTKIASEKNHVFHGRSSQPTKHDSKDNTLSPNQPRQRNDQRNDGCDSSGDHNPMHKTDKKTANAANFRDHSSSNNASIPLFLISWNISETSLSQISATAPDPSLRAQQSASLIREECFRLHFASQQRIEKPFLPDIIALQECPAELWGETVFGPSGYVSVGTQRSHCGLVDLLIRKDFASERIWLKVERTFRGRSERSDQFEDLYQQELPSVAALITLPNKTRFAVASNHLEPHASGASTRAQQCKLLMGALTQKCENVILIGDLNMRQKEDRKIEDLVGGGWIDAWKEGSGSSMNLKFSWDSFSNLYHSNGFGFNARFDRAYVRGKYLGVSKFGLIGNHPVNGTEGDHLSDHFGLTVAVEVAPSLNNDVGGASVAAISDRDSASLDRKITTERRTRNGDYATTNRITSHASQSTSSENSGATISASLQEQGLDQTLQHKHETRYAGWGSDSDSDLDNKIGSEEILPRTNVRRRRARSATATTSKPMTVKSKSKLTAFRGSKKESRSKAEAKKRFKFESSSSDDDEDMRRRLQEKLGKKHKKSKLQHISNDASSDED